MHACTKQSNFHMMQSLFPSNVMLYLITIVHSFDNPVVKLGKQDVFVNGHDKMDHPRSRVQSRQF